MGEEKPEEELMGKRKSSPRLSTAHPVLILVLWSKKGKNIPNQFLFTLNHRLCYDVKVQKPVKARIMLCELYPGLRRGIHCKRCQEKERARPWTK